MKTFFRWLYAAAVYAAATLLVYAAVESKVLADTVYAVQRGTLENWLITVHETVLLTGAASFLTYCLWNAVMSPGLMGRPDRCERAEWHYWLFAVLHTAVLAAVTYYELGMFFPWLQSLPMELLWIYGLPFGVYTLVFLGAARLLAPKNCYVFRRFWILRHKLGL